MKDLTKKQNSKMIFWKFICKHLLFLFGILSLGIGGIFGIGLMMIPDGEIWKFFVLGITLIAGSLYLEYEKSRLGLREVKQ